MDLLKALIIFNHGIFIVAVTETRTYTSYTGSIEVSKYASNHTNSPDWFDCANICHESQSCDFFGFEEDNDMCQMGKVQDILDNNSSGTSSTAVFSFSTDENKGIPYAPDKGTMSASASTEFGNGNGHGCSAAHGIDGIYLVSSSMCTLNEGGNYPWYDLDMRNIYGVKTVELTPRANCCQNRVGNIMVTVTLNPRIEAWTPGTEVDQNTICGQFGTWNSPQKNSLDCQFSISGRYIRLDKTILGNNLDFAELDLIIYDIDETTTTENDCKALSITGNILLYWGIVADSAACIGLCNGNPKCTHYAFVQESGICATAKECFKYLTVSALTITRN